MFTKIDYYSVHKPDGEGDDGHLFGVSLNGAMTREQVDALLSFVNGDVGNDAPAATTSRRRGSSAAATDAGASTSAPETGTTAADAAPATGRRRRGSATEAPAEAPAAETTTRRRRSAPAPEPEAPKIDTSNQGVTLAATTAVRMIGNPADVVALVKEFDDAKGQPCENVSDIPEDMREELLADLNKLVLAKTGKPIPGIG